LVKADIASQAKLGIVSWPNPLPLFSASRYRFMSPKFLG
jgi:hypothetical protein